MQASRHTDEILGVKIDVVSMKEAVERVYDFLKDEGNHMICTPNAEIIYAAGKDKELKEILDHSDMNIADGAGVILGSKIQGKKVREKVSGIDLVKNMIKNAGSNELKLFLLGGAADVAEEAGRKMSEMNQDITIAGCRNGYFDEKDIDNIINEINLSGANVLLAALGAPKQEKFIYKYKDSLDVNISIGVGGTFDVFAGRTRPTPEFMRRHGLEWLHRLYKEPKRIIRMMALPKFVMKALLRGLR